MLNLDLALSLCVHRHFSSSAPKQEPLSSWAPTPGFGSATFWQPRCGGRSGHSGEPDPCALVVDPQAWGLRTIFDCHDAHIEAIWAIEMDRQPHIYIYINIFIIIYPSIDLSIYEFWIHEVYYIYIFMRGCPKWIWSCKRNEPALAVSGATVPRSLASPTSRHWRIWCEVENPGAMGSGTCQTV